MITNRGPYYVYSIMGPKALVYLLRPLYEGSGFALHPNALTYTPQAQELKLMGTTVDSGESDGSNNSLD